MVVPSQRRETKDTAAASGKEQESEGDDMQTVIREGVTTIVLS